MNNLPTPDLKDRRRCVGCDRNMTVILDYPEEWRSMRRPNWPEKPKRKEAIGWHYGGEGHFCTKTCATRWANKIVNSRK